MTHPLNPLCLADIRIGTGKSHLLSRIYQALVYKHGYRPRVAITASTGMAALVCSGQTIHSWAGFHNPFMTVEKAVEKVERSAPVHCRWLEVDVLLIDERKPPLIAASFLVGLLCSLYGRCEVLEPH